MNTDISNIQDIIDSRSVIEKIKELEGEIELFSDDEDLTDEKEELAILKSLQEEAEGYAPDWTYGATLIRESYFVTYTEQYADCVGAVASNAAWPLNHIDWDAAADELRGDYTEVDFDGVTYLVR